mgnify:FL=1
MKGIVDRFEGEYVILEVEGKILSIERYKFPEDIKEGDVVQSEGEKFIILFEETEKRKKNIEDLFNGLIK